MAIPFCDDCEHRPRHPYEGRTVADTRPELDLEVWNWRGTCSRGIQVRITRPSYVKVEDEATDNRPICLFHDLGVGKMCPEYSFGCRRLSRFEKILGDDDD